MSADNLRLELQANTAGVMTESRVALLDSPPEAGAHESISYLPNSRALADVLLGLGLVVLALGAGLWPFPSVGLLGVGAMAAALAIVIAAGVTAGANPSGIAPTRRVIGLMLFAGGAIGMLSATGHAAAVAHARALYVTTELPWSAILFWGPLASIATAMGLGLRAGWSPMKVICWSMIGCEACPVAVAVCNRLAATLPL